MKLFTVPNGRRVRLTSGTLRWAALGEPVALVGEQVMWEGCTTGSYWVYEGVERRLLIEHTITPYEDSGIWQRDTECNLA
jgi:hypothetical protein